MSVQIIDKLEEILSAVTIEKDEKANLRFETDKMLKENKDEMVEDKMKIMKLERRIKERDFEIEQLKMENQQLATQEKAQNIFEEYQNAENYLKELEEEFNNGMKKIYESEISFKDLSDESLTFCERFSNLLFNILLIIDF